MPIFIFSLDSVQKHEDINTQQTLKDLFQTLCGMQSQSCTVLAVEVENSKQMVSDINNFLYKWIAT